MHYLKCPADNLENASTTDCKQTKAGTVRVGVPKRAALYGGSAAVLLPRGAVRRRHVFYHVHLFTVLVVHGWRDFDLLMSG